MMITAILAAALLAQDSLESKIDRLIQQLGSESIEERDQASAELIALGPDALPLLEKRASGNAAVVDAIAKIRARVRRDAILPPVKRITLRAKDEPLKQVLEQVQKQSGLAFDLSRMTGDDRVTVDIEDATAFEALERICASLGTARYQLDGDLTARASRGERRPAQIVVFDKEKFAARPTAFSGRYKVWASELTLKRTNKFESEESEALLQLAMLWQPDSSPENVPTFEIEKVWDDQGTTLFEAKKGEGRTAMFFGSADGKRGYACQPLKLPYPAPGVKWISACGRVVVSYEDEVDTVLFPNPKEEDEQNRGGLKIRITDLSVREETTIGLKVTGATDRWLGFDDVKFQLEDGKLVSHSGGGSSRGRNEQTLNFRLRNPEKKKITAIHIRRVLSTIQEEFAFELKEIPLPK